MSVYTAWISNGINFWLNYRKLRDNDLPNVPRKPYVVSMWLVVGKWDGRVDSERVNFLGGGIGW